MTRADWLAAATEELLPLVNRRAWPADIAIACGPMVHVHAACVGEAWMEDRLAGRITISDRLDDPREALAVLLHELIHLSVGPRHLHSRRFTRVAHRVGFRPPYTESVPTDRLASVLDRIAASLGPYPALEPISA